MLAGVKANGNPPRKSQADSNCESGKQPMPKPRALKR